jgi:hypothetical protein
MRHLYAIAISIVSLLLSTPYASAQEPKELSEDEIRKALSDVRNRDRLLRAPNFLQFVREYEKLKKVTEIPFEMSPNTAGLCIAPVSDYEVHGNRFCDVYVTENANNILRSGNGTYPVGSTIVKAKYPDAKRSKIELFTVMRKRIAGYDPTHGDWEYSVVDGDAEHVLARGRIESCISCHDQYARTDFVTRTYLTSKEKN